MSPLDFLALKQTAFVYAPPHKNDYVDVSWHSPQTSFRGQLLFQHLTLWNCIVCDGSRDIVHQVDFPQNIVESLWDQ